TATAIARCQATKLSRHDDLHAYLRRTLTNNTPQCGGETAPGESCRPPLSDACACALRSRVGYEPVVASAQCGAVDVDVRYESCQPRRQPPGGPAEQRHQGWHEGHAHDERVGENADGESEGDRPDRRTTLDLAVAEHTDHDQRRRYDGP